MKSQIRLFSAALVILFATVSGLASLVDGYCYLEGELDHSGTKVLFVEASPSAVRDSVYTGVAGDYLIDVIPGIYDVYFSHDGFYGHELIGQDFFNPQTLSDITLLFISGTPISGPLSGILTSGEYLVVGDLSIVNGETLTIEPGSIFMFDGNYGFNVESNRTLICQGTETDSIKFIPNYDGGITEWGGIYFSGSDSDDILEFCYVSGSNNSGLYVDNSSPTINECTISGNVADGTGGGIYTSSGSSSTISNSTISGNYAPSSGGGIYSGPDCNPTITNCNIIGNSTHYNGGGISIDYSSPTISDCIISDNTADLNGGGIKAWYSSPNINRCTISGNSAEERGGGIYCDDESNPTVSNCDIIENFADDNGSAIFCWYDSSPIVVNCTITDNLGEEAICVHNIGENNPEFIYCNFYNNLYGDFWPGGDIDPDLGILIAVNANSDSCDAYFNIFLDPQYVDPNNGDYHLQETSPCIDAGDPLGPTDPDGTVADIGAFYFDQAFIPNLEITTPSAGEVWERGTSRNIVWTDNLTENVKIELYHGLTLEQVIAENTESDGSYSWDIPTQGPLDNNYMIKISSVLDGNIFAESDLFTLDYTPPPLLEIYLTADNPLIVPRGGVFSYDVHLINNQPSFTQVDIWTQAVLPNGNPYGPLWQINDFPMMPGASIEALGVGQAIPMGAPLGEFTFRIRAGSYPNGILAQDDFPFVIVSAVTASAGATDWTAYGFREAFERGRITSGLEETVLPDKFTMSRAYPNPFNPSTSINISLPETAKVAVVAYNVNGQQVAELATGTYSAGTHTLNFDASSLAGGVYFVHASIKDWSEVQKVVLIK